jgi:hypothetical protein
LNYQIEWNEQVTQLTDKEALDCAVKTHQSEIELAIALESVQDAEGGIIGD